MIGDIQMEFKDFNGAIKSYKNLKNYCDAKEKFKDKIKCYE